MRTIETNVYTFSELSDAAKKKAREWYRTNDDFSFYAESVIDDAKECARLIGIDVDKVYYSGFCSQGDGACFIGSYRYQKGATKAIRQHAPMDSELHRIADELQKIQRINFYQLRAKVSHRGHYYHELSTVYNYEYQYRNVDEDSISELLRDFMRWIYKQLECEYEFHNSDEQVDEALTYNQYEFTEEGEPV